MTNLSPQTYRTPVMTTVTNVVLAVVAFLLAHWLYVGSGGGLNAHTSVLNAVGSIALLIGSAYCVYLAIPYSIRFNPTAKTYEYRWGVGPLAHRIAGTYSDLDCIFVNETTSSVRLNYRGGEPNPWRTSDTVDVLWAHEHRRVPLVDCGDVEQGKLAAEEIAKATGLPYGGTYDYWNKMWMQGPFHKQFDQPPTDAEVAEIRAEAARSEERILHPAEATVEAAPVPHIAAAPPAPPHGVPGSARAPAAQPEAPHPPAGLTDAPPALGDDAGLNESDMWK